MGFLNHVDIIGSVPDGKRDFVEAVLDEFDDLCFLLGSDTAAYD
jgi:hypothetical protein